MPCTYHWNEMSGCYVLYSSEPEDCICEETVSGGLSDDPTRPGPELILPCGSAPREASEETPAAD